MKFFNARRAAYHTDAKQLDDVIYTPYVYEPSSHAPAPSSAHAPASGAAPVPPAAGATGDLLGVPELRVEGRQMDDGTDGVEAANGNGSGARKKKSKFDATPTEAEIFIFKYGTVVIWGMTEPQEKRFLSSLCVICPPTCRSLNMLTVAWWGSENDSRWKGWVSDHASPNVPTTFFTGVYSCGRHRDGRLELLLCELQSVSSLFISCRDLDFGDSHLISEYTTT